MNDNNLFRTQQFGFRAGRSTTLQLLNVMDLWTEAIDQGQSVDTTSLDFMKVFDVVSRGRMLHKMNACGISETILKWVDNFLVGRTYWVSANGHDSAGFAAASGIPQGSVLGAYSFSDLYKRSSVSHKLLYFLFADDAKIFRVIKHTDDPTLLQGDLGLLCKIGVLNGFFLYTQTNANT